MSHPSGKPASVLVAILNWNRADETIDCLESVLKLDYENFTVLLVDNGSDVGVMDQIVRWAEHKGLHPRVTGVGVKLPEPPPQRGLAIVQTGTNLGYTGGNNVALRQAGDWGVDWVLVLNNDTRLPSDFLSRLAETAGRFPDSGLIGSRVVPSEKAVPTYEGGNLLYGFGVYALWRFRGRRGDVRVNFVPGCAVLARTTMLTQIGLFDERFFLYTEDVDLSYRAMKAGWKLLVNLDTHVDHDLSASMGSRKSPLYYYYVTRNTLLFIRDRLKGIERVSSFSLFLAQSGIRCILWAATGRWQHLAAAATAIGDFAANRSGKAPERSWGRPVSVGRLSPSPRA
jgi:GT2 family glycosyltransferase